MPIAPQTIIEAYTRLRDHSYETPLLSSTLQGHQVWFKIEALQRTGAFKARGALNTLLWHQEQGTLPQKVVAFSSGNHAQGVAMAARELSIPATIYLPSFVSKLKQDATRKHGAEVVLTANRKEAEARTAGEEANGALLIHPFANEHVIAGQGTAAYEAILQGANPTAVFTPIGGGGLLSGTLLALRAHNLTSQVFGAEPANANDAAQSYRKGEIVGFDD